jgi:alpha-L-fucosidase 2
MTEMILQSHVRKDGVYLIDLLPALPDAWPDGKITGLRARGGFGIDLTWRSGKLSEAVITSSNGGKAWVRSNGRIQPLTFKPGGKQIIR